MIAKKAKDPTTITDDELIDAHNQLFFKYDEDYDNEHEEDVKEINEFRNEFKEKSFNDAEDLNSTKKKKLVVDKLNVIVGELKAIKHVGFRLDRDQKKLFIYITSDPPDIKELWRGDRLLKEFTVIQEKPTYIISITEEKWPKFKEMMLKYY